MIVTIPVSVGELVDKITILQIKSDRITDASKLENVTTELHKLMQVLENTDIPDIGVLTAELHLINSELWEIEDFKRDCERSGEFGYHFVNAARQVYIKNDERARVKREINLACGSEIIEEKSYK